MFSQTLTQNLRGKVVDKTSDFPLIGATVIVVNSAPIKGATTDMNGEFVIQDLPIGRVALKIHFLGYKESIIPNVLLGSGKEVMVNIKLEERFESLKEFEVVAKSDKHGAQNKMANVSARTFSVEETQRYAASLNDPARMAQSFAGVSSNDDVSNEIIVRGNSPRGLLWRLNGVEIPSPNHFSDQGASGGGVSVLSNNMLDNSDFFTGAFPAEYGNALSGVFDINLRKGNSQKREYAAQIGVMGIDFAAEGPFTQKSNASYLVNYRYSTLGLLSDLGFLDLGGTNTFQDLAISVNVPTKNLGTFSMFGIGGLSKSGDVLSTDTSQWEGNRYLERGDFISNMGVLGISNKYFINSKMYWKNTLSISGQNVGYELDSVSIFTQSPVRVHNEYFINSTLQFNSVLNHKINARNNMRTGFIVNQKSYDLFLESRNSSTNMFETFLDEKGTTTSYQAYSQWQHKFNENLTSNIGVHYMHLALTKATSVEPRLGASYQINNLQSINFGAGLHSRMETIGAYAYKVENQDGVLGSWNKNLDFSKAWHVVLGYDRQLSEQLRIKTEVYYQHLFNLPESAVDTSTFSSLNYTYGMSDELLTNTGVAQNIGVEFTLEKFFNDGYYYLFTASIFDSKYQAPNGTWYNTKFNSNYRLTALGGKEFMVRKDGKNVLELNGKFILAGGNRYTPINLTASRQAEETVRYDNLAFESQVSTYWRVDFTVNYRINKNNAAHILSLNIQNVSNRINKYSYYYNSNSQNIESIDQFGLLPVLRYRYEF
jgi:hypothetical protein